ncbi:MAG: DUF4397 domain-containing protein [Candidatus Hydrogenedentes bacterium]|nr:DUF4397 domain-containing protein [Candidatus Hydrogenedentota bacterium]
MFKSKTITTIAVWAGIMCFLSQSVYSEALNINFCNELQKVLENQLLEGVDLGEFQFFLDMFQPNNMDLNGKIYVNVKTIPIPNVVGLSEAEAKRVLKAWGFSLADTFYTPHPSVPGGIVITTDPSPNKKVIPGQTVMLRVSTGPGEEQQPAEKPTAQEFLGELEGNGIKDIANEFGLLQRILNDENFDNGVLTHNDVYNAWIHNLQQFQTDMGPTLSALLPGLIPGLQEIFLAFLTLGDGDYTIYSAPVENQFEGYMNGGRCSNPPVPTIAKGLARVTQTVESNAITGLTFKVSFNITDATHVRVLNTSTSSTWWEVAVPQGQQSIVYSPTPEELAQVDTTKLFPDSYWDNFLLIVKSVTYPDGEICVRLGDLDPAGIEAEGYGSFGIIAGLIALLDDQLRKATQEQFGTEMGFDNPFLRKEDYVGLPLLLPDADADGDGASNRCEYEWFEKNYCRELIYKCVGTNAITKEGVDTGSTSTRKGSFTTRVWYDPEIDETYMVWEITPGVTLSKIIKIGIYDGKNSDAPLIYQFPGPYSQSPYTHTIPEAVLETLPPATNPHLIICTTNQPGISERGEIGASLIQYCPELFENVKSSIKAKQETIRYVTAALSPNHRPQYCKVYGGCQIRLRNDKVVPPVPPISSGLVSVDVYQEIDTSDYLVKLTISHNVVNPVSAGIYSGNLGENGPLLIDLGAPTSPIERILTPEEVEAFLNRPVYILITSENYPNGELRAQLDCTAEVRWVNAVYGMETQDVCAKNMPAFILVPYGTATGYVEVASSKYDLKLLPGTGEETTCENTPVLRTSLQIYGDTSYTGIATGSEEYPYLFTLEDNNSPPQEGYAKIRFVNAVKEGYSVDFYFVGWPPELSPLFADVADLTSTNYYGIAAPDTLSVEVKIAGTENLIASYANYTFLPGGVYTIILIGPTPLKNGYQLLILEDVPGEIPTEGEGVVEGEGIVEGEGLPEGVVEGEGVPEGVVEGEGAPEGVVEGIVEGEIEGAIEGEGEIITIHSADLNGNNKIELSELLRVIQFFNIQGYHCALPGEQSEDGYIPGLDGDKSCRPHASDYNPQNWKIELTELLRLIQYFNMNGYYACPGVGEDNFCPGQP